MVFPAVDLDDQVELRPVEVDDVTDRNHVDARFRQPGGADELEEQDLEPAARRRCAVPEQCQRRAQHSDPAMAGAALDRGRDAVVLERPLALRGLEQRAQRLRSEHCRHVEEDPFDRGDRDALDDDAWSAAYAPGDVAVNLGVLRRHGAVT